VVLDWEFYREKCIGIDDRDMLRMMAGDRDWRICGPSTRKRSSFPRADDRGPPFPETLPSMLEALKASSYRMAVVSPAGATRSSR
jgi:hypothetical protein